MKYFKCSICNRLLHCQEYKVRLINQNQSIDEINKIISSEFMKPTIRIIGDISLEEEDFNLLVSKLRLALKADFRINSRRYSECLILCLVYCAQLFFDNNDYWSHVGNHFMTFSYNQRQTISKQFKNICTLYGLPKFERERQLGHAIITPIICHAGIPLAQMYDFFNLYEEAVQDTNQSGITDLTEGIIDYFDMKAPVYIRRFIDSLGEDQSSFFLQWQDITQELYTDQITADELYDALKASYESEDEILISNLFLNQYYEWRNRPIDTTTAKKGRKITLSSPKIFLDAEGMGVYLRLPQQRIQGEYPATKVDWLIRSDNYHKAVSCPVFIDKNEDQAYSEESFIVLKPASYYIVELFSSDEFSEPTSTWTLDLLKKNYISFKTSGELMRSDALYGSESIIIIPDQCILQANCQISELPKLPYWGRFQAFSLSYKPEDSILIYDRVTRQLLYTIPIASSTKPEFYKGTLLFNNPGVYISLPYIKMPQQIGQEWKITLVKSSSRISFTNKEEWSKEIPLGELLSSNEYGQFDIRLKCSNGSRYQLRFYYVPPINMTNDSGRWPEPFLGYHSNRLQLVMPDFIAVSLDYYYVEANVVYERERRILFASDTSFNSVNGHIKMNIDDKTLTVPFKLAIRPLVWSIVGLSTDDLLQMTASTLRKESRHLINEQELYLLITTGDLGAPALQGHLIAQKPNGDLILDKSIQLKSWNRFKLSLIDLLLSPELTDNHRLTISLIIESPDQSIKRTFPLVIISERIKVSTLLIEKEESMMRFYWHETGDKIDRVLICQNIGEPWIPDLLFPVMDGETTVRLPKNIFRKSSYACSIEPTPDISPFSCSEYKPKSLSKKKIFSLGSEKYEDDPLSNYSRKAIIHLLTEKTTELSIEIQSLDQDEDVAKLAKAFLFVEQFPNMFNFEKHPVMGKTYSHVISKYEQLARGCNLSPSKTLNLLLKEHFSSEQLKKLIYFYELNLLKDDQIDLDWPLEDFYEIADSYPELAFQICISSGMYLEWIIRWIGDLYLSELLEKTPGQSLYELIKKRFVENNSEQLKWGSHPSYWGSVKDNFEFARFVAELKPSEQSLPVAELLNFYNQNNNDDDNRRLFDKNYLQHLQKLKTLISDCEGDVNKIINYVRKTDRQQMKKLKDIYPVIIRKLENRTDYSDNKLNELAYSIGFTVFVGVLYRHGLWKQYDKPLVRYLALINRLFPELYRHDLVLIELYLLGGGN